MTLTPPGQPDPSSAPSGPAPRPAPPGVFVPTGGPPPGSGPVPLRPLGLSDLFDASFKVVRRNASATVGMGLLVGLGFAVIPLLLSVAIGASTTPGLLGGPQALEASPNGVPGFTDGDVASIALLLGSSLLWQVAACLVHGVVAPVTSRAAIGERQTLGAAWQRVRPVLGRLLLLALLVLLAGLAPLLLAVGGGLAAAAAGASIGGSILIGVGLAALLFLAWVYLTVRYLLLAPAVLVIERRGLGSALARAGRLSGPPSQGPFWRLLGLYLLMWIVASLVVGFVSTPLSLLGVGAQLGIGGSTGSIVYLVVTQLSGVLGVTLTAPFLGVVRSLLYLDQRFRREGLDVELIQYVHEHRDRD